ncbi:MAG: WD40 repeat domain-containing protein [Chloroflexia bacterium]
MAILRQVGIYAPLLVYIWLAAAYAVGYLRTRRPAFSRRLFTLFLFSISFVLRAWTTNPGTADNAGWLPLLGYLLFAAFPLFEIWSIVKGGKDFVGYRHPTDLLFFKRPVDYAGDADAISIGAQPDYGTRLSLLFGLPLLAAVAGFAGWGLQTCNFLDVAVGESGCIGYFKYDDQVNTFDFSRDGVMIAAGGFEHWAQISRLPDGRPLHKLNGHTESVYGVAFSPDGAVLATGATDGTLRFWRTSDGASLRTISLADLKDGFDTNVDALAFSPDGKLIATGSSGGSEHSVLRLWEASGSKPVKTWASGGGQIAFSPDGTLLAMEGQAGGIELRTVPDGKVVRTLHTTGAFGLTGLAYSPDGKYVAASQYGDPGPIDVMRVTDGKVVHTFHPDKWRAETLAFSPDGKYLATGGLDNPALLWDLATEKLVRAWPLSRYGTTDKVAFSPDGKMLAAASGWMIFLWRVPR